MIMEFSQKSNLHELLDEMKRWGGRYFNSAIRMQGVADYQRVLRQIDLLKRMTTSRGCTPAEAEVAARKIGEAVQRHDLVVVARSTGGHPRNNEQQGSKRTFAIEHVQAIAQTDRAILCVIDGEDIWIPRSQIVETSEVQEGGDFGVLVVSRWFAERRGWLRAAGGAS